jgi:vacuolar protein sorting-associated protein 13A/C
MTICRVVTKPAVGVFDLASNVSEGSFSTWFSGLSNSDGTTIIGIRNTTTVFDNPERDRTRLASFGASSLVVILSR